MMLTLFKELDSVSGPNHVWFQESPPETMSLDVLCHRLQYYYFHNATESEMTLH